MLEVIATTLEDAKRIEACGALNKDKTIDLSGMKNLCDAVVTMEVTCHRAIDASRDPLEFLTHLVALPKIKRVLTSGGPGQAINNIGVLKQMHKLLDDRGQHLLVGCGISISNFQAIMQESGAREIHIGTSVREEGSLLKGIDVDCLRILVDQFKAFG